LGTKEISIMRQLVTVSNIVVSFWHLIHI